MVDDCIELTRSPCVYGLERLAWERIDASQASRIHSGFRSLDADKAQKLAAGAGIVAKDP